MMDPGTTPMSPVNSSMIALSEGHHAVYRLSFPNGKKYIGVTTDLTRRLKQHKYADTLVGRAIRKYGAPELQILAVCFEDYAYDLERKIVKRFDTMVPAGYNLVSGGLGGRKMSEATKLKISRAGKGKRRSSETRERMSKAQKGHPCSEETRRKLVESHHGKRLSAGTKAKISIALKGKKKSAEHRANISKAKMGVKQGSLSAEHRQKISEANRGRKGTTQGPLSVEHRQKISEAVRASWARRRASA